MFRSEESIVFVNLKDDIVTGWGTAKPHDGSDYVEYDKEVQYGWKYDRDNKTFIIPDAMKFSEIRSKRNQLLKDSDYTQLSDSAHKGTKEEWKVYRQKLRDITKDVTDPDVIVFPEEPK
jgi:hypothetical protein